MVAGDRMIKTAFYLDAKSPWLLPQKTASKSQNRRPGIGIRPGPLHDAANSFLLKPEFKPNTTSKKWPKEIATEMIQKLAVKGP
jgi:hypothetical protein